MNIITRKGKLSNYQMEVKGNFLVITGEGLFTVEDAKNFMDDFRTITKANPTHKMNLVIDNVNLKTAQKEVNALIGEMSILYRDTSFAKKYMVMPNSSVSGMQLKRNDTTGFLSQIEFIDTIEELNI